MNKDFEKKAVKFANKYDLEIALTCTTLTPVYSSATFFLRDDPEIFVTVFDTDLASGQSIKQVFRSKLSRRIELNRQDIIRNQKEIDDVSTGLLIGSKTENLSVVTSS